MIKIERLILFVVFLFLVSALSAQEVTGAITDTEGNPLPGVTVVVQGTQIGTVADDNGIYSIKVPDIKKDILVFSFIGMKTEAISLDGKTRLNLVMQDNHIMMDPMVVIGYGTVKRRDLTGSVASINSDALEKIPVSTIGEALTGRLAGVQVVTTDGAPDAEIKINVRGGGSITQDNTPLYVVDGFPVSSIADLAPSNIASIDVLKDASSTAIYGSRGANGVVMITTKSAQSGKFNVSVNSYLGYRKMANAPGVLDPYEYALWQYEQSVYRKETDSMYEPYFGSFDDIELYKGVTGNDWKKIVLGRAARVLNYNTTVSGSTDKMRYSANVANETNKGIMIGSYFRRTNLSFKMNHKVSSKVSLDFNARYSDMKVEGAGTNEQSGGRSSDPRMKYVMQYSPIPLKNVGLGDDIDDEDFYNNSGLFTPTQYIADNDRIQYRRTLSFQGGFSWDIISNLKFRTNLGLDLQWYEDQRFFGITTYYSRRTSSISGKPAIGIINSDRKQVINSNTLEYDFKNILPKNHSLNFLLGQELVTSERRLLTTNVDGFPESFDARQAFKLTTQGTAVSTDNYYEKPDKLFSFFSRANYTFDNRYLLSATFRADGSSRFERGNRWGYFPSVAGGWRINEESFLKSTKWLHNLKLRASYGLAGNNNIPPDVADPPYKSGSTTFLPEGIISGSSSSTSYWSKGDIMSNRDLKWETTTTRNVGLDYGILQGRISGTVDLYYNTTDDLLIRFPVSGSGYKDQYRNLGSTQNKGLEFTINAIAVDNEDFGLDFSFNVSMNRNKITDLGGLEEITAYSSWASTEIDYDFIVRKGEPLGQIYGYVSEGRYAASDFTWTGSVWKPNDGVVDNSYLAGTGWGPGAVKFKDLDENGAIEASKDREVLGSALPKATGGFSVNGRYKGFDLSANFNYSYGNKILNVNKGLYSGTGKYRYLNMLTNMDSNNRWKSIDDQGNIITDIALLDEMNANTTMWTPATGYRFVSSWMVEDGSFLRLSTLTLGYTLPAKWTNKYNIRGLRFYVTGTNLFCLTDYTGFDPEVDTRRTTPLTPGVDYSSYPKTRGFIVGLNLNF